MCAAPTDSFVKAKEVLQAFLDASNRHDDKAMHACLTRRSLEDGEVSTPEALDGAVFVMDEPQAEGEMVVIHLKALPPGAANDAQPVMELNCLLVQEDGRWKFDLAGTAERMMAGLESALGAAMGQMATAMSEAMEGVGKAMSDGLSQAFGEATPAEPTPAPECARPREGKGGPRRKSGKGGKR